MSLNSALSIGRSALAANQAAVEVAGNNLANAASAGYTRQSAVLASHGSVEIQPNTFVGTGAKLQKIVRQVDEALNTRLRAAVGEQAAAQTRSDLLSQVESIQNALADTSLGSRLDAFFNAWSELGNNPADDALRRLAIEQSQSVAGHVQGLRNDLTRTLNQLDDRLTGQVDQLNSQLEQIGSLNRQIAVAESGRGAANGLRDQRDQLLADVAERLDISTNELKDGSVNVLLNGISLVTGDQVRGLKAEFRAEGDHDQLTVRLRLAEEGTFVDAQSGSIGELIQARQRDVIPAITTLDDLAGNLIHQVNRVVSQGQGETAYRQLRGTTEVEDPAASLSNMFADLPSAPKHGSFEVHLTQQSTGQRNATRIPVDLDGLGGPDTSLNDLAAQLDGVANLNASVDARGRLVLETSSDDFRVSFAEDSAGVLAALGVNTLFTGRNAAGIGVNAQMSADPTRLPTAADHVPGGNATALAVANLRDRALPEVGGPSVTEQWSAHVEDYAVRAERAALDTESAGTIVESLDAQREAVSGVSVDEESIDLLAFQRAYQGSARFVTVVDELMQTLLGMAR